MPLNKPEPRKTFIPKASDMPVDVSVNANNNDNNNANTHPPVARYKDSQTKTVGLRMPIWISDEWATWCKERGWAIGPTAGQALLEYMDLHKEDR